MNEQVVHPLHESASRNVGDLAVRSRWNGRPRVQRRAIAQRLRTAENAQNSRPRESGMTGGAPPD